MCNGSARNAPSSGYEKSGGSLKIALVQHWQHNAPPPQRRGPIYRVPVEILFTIFQLLASPGTRDGVYTLLELTHVCQFWRAALTNEPRAWATIFITGSDRRSFVETCLERSQSAPLDVIMNVSDRGPFHPSCTCGRNDKRRLIPNDADPCEWHFAFESLARREYWKRIHTLKILFGNKRHRGRRNSLLLSLRSCRFFGLPPLELTDLEWADTRTLHTIHLFPAPPSSPALCSISLKEPLHRQLMKLDNLTSFTLNNHCGKVTTEVFRTFILNNRSLERLSLGRFKFRGTSNKPPVTLPNLQSLIVDFPREDFPTLFRVPALRRLSSLSIFNTEGHDRDMSTFRATGDGIVFAVKHPIWLIAEAWECLTGYAGPSIQHVCFDGPVNPAARVDWEAVFSLFTDVHTLEVGRFFAPDSFPGFWHSLKELVPQLKTIRFEIPGEAESLEGPDDGFRRKGGVLHRIEDLVAYRFEHGRPFSSVERRVVSESEQVNLQQESVWRCFYNGRRLGRYLQ